MAHKINLVENKGASHNTKYVEPSRKKYQNMPRKLGKNVKSGAFVSLAMNKIIHRYRRNTDPGPNSKGVPEGLRLTMTVREHPRA